MDKGLSKLGSSESFRERLLNWRGLARMGAVRNCDCPVSFISQLTVFGASQESHFFLPLSPI